MCDQCWWPSCEWYWKNDNENASSRLSSWVGRNIKTRVVIYEIRSFRANRCSDKVDNKHLEVTIRVNKRVEGWEAYDCHFTCGAILVDVA